ncbi:hypothetical protein L208DRAFT_1376077 [Tricholoma matsutake]|nr:hypothetical protein L208DRAFT_1376077 [Tricholoma matsutake 945]
MDYTYVAIWLSVNDHIQIINIKQNKHYLDHGISTGIEHVAHWHNTAAGGHDGLLNGQVAAPAAPAGNAANAVEVATTQAKKLLVTQIKTFKKYNLPTEIHEAQPKGDMTGTYGFIFLNEKIMLGKGPNGNFSVSYVDETLFKKLNQVLPTIKTAIKALGSRKGNRAEECLNDDVVDI